MSNLYYMPMYWGDYLAATRHFEADEHGAYMLLIAHLWQTGKPLPAEPARLARVACMTLERWSQVQQTLAPFFQVRDGFWFHARVEAELAKARAMVEKNRTAGKLSAAARKTAIEKTHIEKQQQSNARSTPVASTLQPKSNQSESESELKLEIKNTNLPQQKNSTAARETVASSGAHAPGCGKLVFDDAFKSKGKPPPAAPPKAKRSLPTERDQAEQCRMVETMRLIGVSDLVLSEALAQSQKAHVNRPVRHLATVLTKALRDRLGPTMGAEFSDAQLASAVAGCRSTMALIVDCHTRSGVPMGQTPGLPRMSLLGGLQ